ncbi:putative quinol monooxygenase [Puia dinghuensis]|uniref:Antibiotic biosynthesis monooxygenase n=1 Tax=Puia dinghuensis TaxID=1792502 RepID=A0A8J2UDP7_9BACT|nr:antibiotic biosynthesis monooxygenase [Puia dinghuensis]GGB02055.1 antibiotic biosynthesis monooxygenase [Puia dinghuensis]
MKFRTVTIFILFLFLKTDQLTAQNNTGPYMRIARIVVDSTQLGSYKAALKEGITAAVKMEPGVLSLSAVYEKEHPTHVTVFEIYADENAYRYHIQTAHFLKYKHTVEHMVKSLELVDVSPIAIEAKH